MIRISEIRVIDEEGEQLGVMATDKARAIACLLYTSDAADE